MWVGPENANVSIQCIALKPIIERGSYCSAQLDTDIVHQVKCTIFWLNIGLGVYLDLYVPDFSKSTSKSFF